jgi:predicted porin
MKKTLAAALLGAAAGAVASNAAAQDGVSIYGSIDSGITWISNAGGGRLSRVDSGNLQPDRIGFRGREDLGGGWNAVFQLENGYVTDTGAQINAAKLFNRSAYAGIGNGWGTLSFGRQNNFMFDMVGKHSNGFLLSSFYAFHPGNIDDLTNAGAYDNAVKFVSAPLAGTTLGAMYALGEQAGDAARNRAFSLGASYANGPLRLAAALSDSNNRSLALGQSLGIRSLLGRTLITGTAQAPVFATLAADKVRTAALAASYEAGSAMLHGLYMQTDIVAGASSATMTSAEVGVNYRLAATDSINAGITGTRLGDLHWNQLTLVHVHSFSRRTSLYALAIHQQASGPGAVAAINSLGYASGSSQSALRVGIHHLF